MLKPLRYFFFRVYSWKRSSEGESLAAFTACVATAVIVCMYILTVQFIVRRAMGFNGTLTGDRNTTRMIGMAVGVLILVGFYRAWIASSYYKRFAEEFRDETDSQRRSRTILVIVGAIVSFLLPFAVMMIPW